MQFANNFNEILLAFSNAGVDFMVVGGYAVNFHGYVRTTSDLDIWINPVESNKIKITKALIVLGFLVEGDIEVTALDFSIPCCFSLGEENNKVDIFTHLGGVNYEQAALEKIPFHTEGEVVIYFISYRHLITNKLLADRMKDKADVEELQKISKFKKL